MFFPAKHVFGCTTPIPVLDVPTLQLFLFPFILFSLYIQFKLFNFYCPKNITKTEMEGRLAGMGNCMEKLRRSSFHIYELYQLFSVKRLLHAHQVKHTYSFFVESKCLMNQKVQCHHKLVELILEASAKVTCTKCFLQNVLLQKFGTLDQSDQIIYSIQ